MSYQLVESYSDFAEVIHFLQEDVVRGGLTAHLVAAFDKESDTW